MEEPRHGEATSQCEPETAADRSFVSVVVPVYNEAANLRTLWARLEPVMRACGRPWEVLFVDDGSADQSLDILREIAATAHGAVRAQPWSAEAETRNRPQRLRFAGLPGFQGRKSPLSFFSAAQDDAALLHSNTVTHIRSAAAGAYRTARVSHFYYFLVRTLPAACTENSISAVFS